MDLISSVNKLFLIDQNEILYIRINKQYIWINNFFTKVIDEYLTPHDLGALVKEATQEKCHHRKYSADHIDIIVKNEEGLGGDACVDYFDTILPSEMPEIIFREGVEVKYVYYVDDE
jgi:hypothetical protein